MNERQRNRTSRILYVAISILILGGLAGWGGYTVYKARKVNLCNRAKVNFLVACGEAANELDTVDRANRSFGPKFDAMTAINNIIWRHTGRGTCTELFPGICEKVVPSDERDPFHPERPSLVFGKENLTPHSGQVALYPHPDYPREVIGLYRDLTWAPYCGEETPFDSLKQHPMYPCGRE